MSAGRNKNIRKIKADIRKRSLQKHNNVVSRHQTIIKKDLLRQYYKGEASLHTKVGGVKED